MHTDCCTSFISISDFIGGDGGVYPSHVQSLLPRLLSAAAPRGNAASENRRQCLKVRTSRQLLLDFFFFQKTL